jgi:hypothetical protein
MAASSGSLAPVVEEYRVWRINARAGDGLAVADGTTRGGAPGEPNLAVEAKLTIFAVAATLTLTTLRKRT